MFCGKQLISFGALWSFSFRSIHAKLSFTALGKFDFDHIKFGCCCSNQTFIILKAIFQDFPIQFHNDVVWLKSKGSNFFNVIITFLIILISWLWSLQVKLTNQSIFFFKLFNLQNIVFLQSSIRLFSTGFNVERKKFRFFGLYGGYCIGLLRINEKRKFYENTWNTENK